MNAIPSAAQALVRNWLTREVLIGVLPSAINDTGGPER
jgi:hypothetical protein